MNKSNIYCVKIFNITSVQNTVYWLSSPPIVITFFTLFPQLENTDFNFKAFVSIFSFEGVIGKIDIFLFFFLHFLFVFHLFPNLI